MHAININNNININMNGEWETKILKCTLAASDLISALIRIMKLISVYFSSPPPLNPTLLKGIVRRKGTVGVISNAILLRRYL